jgi:hypothetical protein
MLQWFLCTGKNRILLKDQNWKYDIHDRLAVQWQGGNEKHTKESIICKDAYAQEEK